MKQNTQSIVCLTMTTWEGDYMKTIVHMMGKLAANHNVLFVNYPFTWKDVFVSFFRKANFSSLRTIGLKSRVEKKKYGENTVHVLTLPPILPVNWINNHVWHDRIMRWQAAMLAKTINKHASKLGMGSPTVINAFNPVVGLPLLGKLNEKSNIYYCYDEISGATWCHKHGIRSEQAFLPKVDAVVVTSAELLHTKQIHNPTTHLIENGVDFQLFNQAWGSTKSEGIKRVGYIGSIDHRLDYTLLTSVISAMPQVTFVFVGRITSQQEAKALGKLPNVTFVPPQAPQALPELLKTMDIGIIPFVKNNFTKSIYPLKINEYLAAGLPVVATSFTDFSQFGSVVSLADTSETFANAITLQLATDNIDAQKARINHALKNDWSERATRMEALLESTIKNG